MYLLPTRELFAVRRTLRRALPTPASARPVRRRAANAAVLTVLTPTAFLAPLAAPGSSPEPEPVEAEVFSLPVSGVDRGALDALGLPAAGPEAPELLTGELRTDAFTTVGVSWERDPALTEVEVHVRIRTDGEWSDWEDLHAEEADGPDLVDNAAAPTGAPAAGGPEVPVVGAAETTPEADVTAITVQRQSTPPVWAGRSDGVQVRVDAEGGVPRGVEVELVDPGESPADATVGQLPAGAASAATARPAVVSRAQWGADESIRRGSPSYSGTIKAGFIHHTVNSNSYSQAEAPALVRSIYAYHVKSNGWSDVGYNFMVDRFGTIYEGRAGGIDRAVIGAHAAGFNTDTFGVSIIGDFTSVAPPAAALTAVQRVMAWKLSLHGLDPNATTTLTSAGGGTNRFAAGERVSMRVVSGHRDGNLTACPGARTYALLPQIRSGIKSAMSGPTPSTPTVPAQSSTAASSISAAYARMGGTRSALGSARTGVLPTADGAGWYTHYETGSIYWHPATGAHEVHGAIHGAWSRQRWEQGPLGYPVTDELGTPDGVGRYNHFQRGSVYWTPGTNAHEVRGAIRDRWARLGWENGVLGYPVTDELTPPDGRGRFTHFQRGSVYWTPAHGAHDVYGSIRDAWARSGWEAGPLGYPTSGEYSVPGGRANDFERGRLVWDGRTGAVRMIRS